MGILKGGRDQNNVIFTLNHLAFYFTLLEIQIKGILYTYMYIHSLFIPFSRGDKIYPSRFGEFLDPTGNLTNSRQSSHKLILSCSAGFCETMVSKKQSNTSLASYGAQYLAECLL